MRVSVEIEPGFSGFVVCLIRPMMAMVHSDNLNGKSATGCIGMLAHKAMTMSRLRNRLVWQAF